jgi:transcriptional regulator with XRE-family HTH domain
VGFVEERLMAEQALSASELDETVERTFPPAAHRIRRAREALALTQDDVASRWGEHASMYWDLELYDDDVFANISVRQLQRLAAVLGTSVNALLFGEEPASNLPSAPYVDVVARLRVRMAEAPSPSSNLEIASAGKSGRSSPIRAHSANCQLVVCDRFVEPLASIG